MNCDVSIETEILVIGYGNSLRGDDGVGPRVAEAIGQLLLPGVRTLICALLTPELADPISRARKVVFVDAEIVHGSGFEVPGSGIPNPEPATPNFEHLRWRKLEPNETSQLMAHAADPRTMLALARDVFGCVPAAWWLTIPAVDLGFQEEFSPAVQRNFEDAVERLRLFCVDAGKPVAPPCGR
jgi:Ni,Fe-hydrogenase maturation factor